MAEICRGENPRNPAHRAAALRRRPHGRDHHQHRRYPQRRNEGADHRPRRAQHPRLREGHRRRRDHRRHAGRGDRQRLRHGPPRGGPHVAQQADRRRPHPSHADRGDRRRNARASWSSTCRNMAKRRRRRPTCRGCIEDHPSAGPAAVPHQLQPERAAALDRSGLSGRHDGRRDRPRRHAWPAAADCCTTSARRPTTRPKAAIPRSAPNC